jgi:hypothetical protein
MTSAVAGRLALLPFVQTGCQPEVTAQFRSQRGGDRGLDRAEQLGECSRRLLAATMSSPGTLPPSFRRQRRRCIAAADRRS